MIRALLCPISTLRLLIESCLVVVATGFAVGMALYGTAWWLLLIPGSVALLVLDMWLTHCAVQRECDLAAALLHQGLPATDEVDLSWLHSALQRWERDSQELPREDDERTDRT